MHEKLIIISKEEIPLFADYEEELKEMNRSSKVSFSAVKRNTWYQGNMEKCVKDILRRNYLKLQITVGI